MNLTKQFSRRALLGAAMLALAACATTQAPEPEPAIYVLRHFDTPAGERDPELTPAGRARAAALAARLADAGIGAIYVTPYLRTRRTAEPLAAALGLDPIVYDPADTPGLIARLRAAPGSVLVVGHSNTVPDIVEGLGATRPAPIEHQDFGDVWRIRSDGIAERFRIEP